MTIDPNDSTARNGSHPSSPAVEAYRALTGEDWRPSTPYADAAKAYHDAGWSPLPVDGKVLLVTGFTGNAGRPATASDVAQWADQHADANIALRLPLDVIAIDVDAYDGKPGADTFAELEARLGALPPTMVATARPLPSGKLLYRVPNGTRLRSTMGPGIDVCQHHHRYVVVAPSVHHSGAPVRWVDSASGEVLDDIPEPADLPELPWAWLEEFSGSGAGDVALAAVVAEVDAWLQRTEHGRAVPVWLDKVLERVEARIAAGDSRHDTMLTALCQVARESEAGAYPAHDAVLRLREAWDRATAGEGRQDELPDMVAWAVGQLNTAAGRERVAEKRAAVDEWNRRHQLEILPPAPVAADRAAPSTASDELAVLPDDFWSASATLDAIRQAARSSLAPPDAVLNAVLARLAAATPHTVKLPGGVGLTYYAAAIGWPGSGKTVATRTSRLIAPPPSYCPELPGGTGEGVVESYFDFVEEENESGNKAKVKRQVRHNLLTIWDEGTQLDETAGRQGATILTVLRAAYSDDVLGMTTGSLDRRRVLSPGQYVLGVIIGFQPTRASGLLADVDAGTPQRFVWLAATDPQAPDALPAWPDGLLIEPVTSLQLEPYKRTIGGYVRHELVVPPSMASAALAHRQRGLRGKERIEPMDVHEPMVRSKVAALLALLDRRLELADEDWQLAGIVMDTSRTVRTQVQEAVASTHMVREADFTQRQVRREAASEEAAYRRALASAAGSVAKKVAREGSATRRTLARAISGKHRQLGVTVDDAIDRAVEDGTIRPDGDQWVTGRRAA